MIAYLTNYSQSWWSSYTISKLKQVPKLGGFRFAGHEGQATR